jgi:hypothetical protein
VQVCSTIFPSNCSLTRIRSRTRKKRQTMSGRSLLDYRAPSIHESVSNIGDEDPSPTNNAYHTPDVTLGLFNIPKSPQQHEWTGSTEHTFMGRSHYIRDEEEINETTARSFPSARATALSHLDMSTIASYNGFHVPAPGIRNEYATAFSRYCAPWMPVLSSNDKNDLSRAASSPLLAQAFYMAGSRVLPTKRPDLPSTSDLYHRAKVLFWIGHESSPLNSIKACLLMQWYNPEGPEHVSLDTSEFWLRAGVGLAYQVGLHKEPPPGPCYSLRRRLWWSLVVCIL